MKIKLHFSIWLIFLVLTNSCIKENLKSPIPFSTQQNNEKVFVWLNTQKKTFTKSREWIDSVAHALNFHNQQEIIFDTNETFLIIPLDLNIKKEIGKSFQINTRQTFLLVIKDKEGNILSGDLLGINSSQKYTENYVAGLIKSMFNFESEYNKDKFNGIVSVLKLNKSFLLQATYIKGKYTQRKVLQKDSYIGEFHSSNKRITQKDINPNTAICEDWYWVTTDDETGEIISVEYAFTLCDDEGGGGSGDNGVLEDATIWESVPGEPSPHLCPTSNNFSFTTIGNSFTGQIEHLGMSLLGPAGQFMNIEFGSTCLSIPSYGINSAEASSLFIQAYNAAVDDIFISLNNGTLLPKEYLITSAFKKRITARLQYLVPGSTMSTGSGCGGSVPITNAHYC